MGLANPLALWLLLLLIPLILAWKRRPRLTKAVGNAFLWQQVTSQSATSFVTRLRRNWLLVAQVAFLFAVVAALARPVLPFGARTVAVILDLSASMGVREGSATRLDAAIGRAISTLESFPRGTRVRLIAARSVPDQIGEYAAWDPVLRRVIHAQEITAGPADVSAAIETARSGDGVAPTEIHVFSDGPPDASVRWVGIGKPAPNAAITNVAARRLSLASEEGQVLVEARNFWTEPLNAEIEVARNGSLVGRYPVRLPAQHATTMVVDVPRIDGVISARLVADDVLEVDNLRWAMLPSIRPVRVLLTGGSFFVEKALVANRALLVDRLPSRVRHDVHVCEDCSELPPGEAAVLFIPGASRRRADAALMTVSAPNHPIARALDPTGIRAVLVARAAGDAASGDDSIVIARISGQPAVLAYELSGRRVVELRLDVTDPSLAVSTAFPILMANAIEWLAARGENPRELVAGDPLQWVFREKPAEHPEVIGPTGRRVASVRAGSRLTSSSTYAAGVYVVRGGAAQETFVVNPATDGESDLSVAGSVAQNALPPAPVTSRVEQQVVTPLLLLALGVLSVEWWLRCRAVRRA